MQALTREELVRYSRHLSLADFGVEGQEKLKAARVLVVGAGGLGSPVLFYLAAAGVGDLRIADDDEVALSNLQRQILFTVDDLGRNKAAVAAERLARLNTSVKLQAIQERITSGNALQVAGDCDVIVDATDNFATRYLLNDACVLAGKPLIYGSILRFEGHVAAFNVHQPDGSFSCNYRDLFPEPPDPDSVPNCEQAGVIGVLAGMIGTMQANEAIKIIAGIGEPLANKLLIIDALSMEQQVFRIRDRRTRETIRELIDYENFCGISRDKNKSLDQVNSNVMKEVTVQELKQMKESGADFQLIDVREPHEYDICNLDGELIPMSDIPDNVDRISRDKQVILHCRSGKRSGDMLLWLEKNHGFTNLYNLKGGVLAWAREIDPEMPTY